MFISACFFAKETARISADMNTELLHASNNAEFVITDTGKTVIR